MSKNQVHASRTIKAKAAEDLVDIIEIEYTNDGLEDGDEGHFFSVTVNGRLAVQGYIDENGVVDECSLTFDRHTDRGMLQCIAL